jgi:SAM-dependent methyltransferase
VHRTPGTEGYAEAAPHLLGVRLAFDAVHEPILHLIPSQPSHILDVGSGPGHDAAMLSQRGHWVVAAEPTPELLFGAISLYESSNVEWIDDALPDLNKVMALGRRFDFILMSGVWMHLDTRERRKAMVSIVNHLQPNGVVALSIRHGPAPVGRRMFKVMPDETINLAQRFALSNICNVERDSIQAANRAMGVAWTFLAFRR